VLTAAEAEFLDDAVLYGAAAGGARQALAIAQLHNEGTGLLIAAVRVLLARHQLVVDVELAVPHLEVIPGETADALDVIGRGIGRQFEHDNIASLRQARERQIDTAGKQR